MSYDFSWEFLVCTLCWAELNIVTIQSDCIDSHYMLVVMRKNRW